MVQLTSELRKDLVSTAFPSHLPRRPRILASLSAALESAADGLFSQKNTDGAISSLKQKKKNLSQTYRRMISRDAGGRWQLRPAGRASPGL
jgi:hypothetical protein